MRTCWGAGYYNRFFSIRAVCRCQHRQQYRKVTIWARVQAALGAKVVSVMPLVTPRFTDQPTALR